MKVTIKTYSAIKWALVAIGCIGLVLLFLDITDWGVVLSLLYVLYLRFNLKAPFRCLFHYAIVGGDFTTTRNQKQEKN